MKKTAVIIVAISVAGIAGAALYTDAVGDEHTGNGILDIVSVEVQNDATDIMFTINLAGDPTSSTGADWGKYMVGIDRVVGGDTTGNGWGRPISMSSGMDYWIGSWVDAGGGAETYSWDGVSAWNLDNATYSPPSDIGISAVTTNSVTLKTSLASIGMSIGDVIYFDVFTSGGGGGDGAIDALSDPNQTIADWGESYVSNSTLLYPIPEPASLGLIGLVASGIFFTRRIFTV